jgi:hypothetical protein
VIANKPLNRREYGLTGPASLSRKPPELLLHDIGEHLPVFFDASAVKPTGIFGFDMAEQPFIAAVNQIPDRSGLQHVGNEVPAVDAQNISDKE